MNFVDRSTCQTVFCQENANANARPEIFSIFLWPLALITGHVNSQSLLRVQRPWHNVVQSGSALPLGPANWQEDRLPGYGLWQPGRRAVNASNGSLYIQAKTMESPSRHTTPPCRFHRFPRPRRLKRGVRISNAKGRLAQTLFMEVRAT